MNEDLKYLCKVAKLYEEKLEELMSKEDYAKFMRDTSRCIRKEMIAEMPDSSFKDFLLNLDKMLDERSKDD